MVTLIKGQKADLTKVNPALSELKIGVGWDIQKGQKVDLDVLALLVNAEGKVADSRQVVYYNNLSSQEGGVKLSEDNRTGVRDGDDEEIHIELPAVSPAIQRIVIAVNIHQAKEKAQNFGHVSRSYARILNGKTGEELYRYDLENDFQPATTVSLGEVYRHKGEWKFAAIGKGMENGLAELLSLYQFDAKNLNLEKRSKIDVKKEAVRTEKPSSINLSKVELKKSGDKINLSKTDEPLGEILINLNWNQKSNQGSKGFFSSLMGGTDSVDLDLGCLYEMQDGSVGVVQALGNQFGDLRRFPYIHLDKDDRTGASKGGENLRINGNKVSEIRRVLVFAFIYQGAANWSQVDGVVTLKQKNGPDVIVRLDDHRNGMGMCAIALLENIQNQNFSVKKLVKYYKGHREMDRAFKWGLRWTAGSK